MGLHLITRCRDLYSVLILMHLTDSCGQGQGRSMEGQYAWVTSPAGILGFLTDIIAFQTCLELGVHATEDGPAGKKQA